MKLDEQLFREAEAEERMRSEHGMFMNHDSSTNACKRIFVVGGVLVAFALLALAWRCGVMCDDVLFPDLLFCCVDVAENFEISGSALQSGVCKKAALKWATGLTYPAGNESTRGAFAFSQYTQNTHNKTHRIHTTLPSITTTMEIID